MGVKDDDFSLLMLVQQSLQAADGSVDKNNFMRVTGIVARGNCLVRRYSGRGRLGLIGISLNRGDNRRRHDAMIGVVIHRLDTCHGQRAVEHNARLQCQTLYARMLQSGGLATLDHDSLATLLAASGAMSIVTIIYIHQQPNTIVARILALVPLQSDANLLVCY